MKSCCPSLRPASVRDPEGKKQALSSLSLHANLPALVFGRSVLTLVELLSVYTTVNEKWNSSLHHSLPH